MKFIGICRIGNDPQLKQTESGTAYTRLSLAYTYYDKEKKTQWIDAALIGKKAEAVTPYLERGNQVCVTLDNLRIEEYTNKDGEMKNKLSATIGDIELVNNKKEDDGKSQRVTKPEPARQAPKPAPKPTGTGFDDLDDDIPF